ncbi:MAG: translation elongation factor Ts [Anaerolineae bacterium]|nr:translation elongation factor Ts [Anaerolineae bacterium]
MAITAEMVKALRETTGAAVLDCKKALEQFQGDPEKAKAYLAEKGLVAAKKKTDRKASDGKVETYSHAGGRVGVMVEVNCETDFVAKTAKFQELAHELALHIAFADPRYVDVSDIPAAELEAKKQEFYQDAKVQGKPENVIEKIVEGRLEKYYADVCLLQQPFVKDEDVKVGDLVMRTIAEMKENVVVSRFARFELGRTAEDDGSDEE